MNVKLNSNKFFDICHDDINWMLVWISAADVWCDIVSLRSEKSFAIEMQSFTTVWKKDLVTRRHKMSKQKVLSPVKHDHVSWRLMQWVTISSRNTICLGSSCVSHIGTHHIDKTHLFFQMCSHQQFLLLVFLFSCTLLMLLHHHNKRWRLLLQHPWTDVFEKKTHRTANPIPTKLGLAT